MIQASDLKPGREYDLMIESPFGTCQEREALYVGPGEFGTMKFELKSGFTCWLKPEEIIKIRAGNDVTTV